MANMVLERLIAVHNEDDLIFELREKIDDYKNSLREEIEKNILENIRRFGNKEFLEALEHERRTKIPASGIALSISDALLYDLIQRDSNITDSMATFTDQYTKNTVKIALEELFMEFGCRLYTYVFPTTLSVRLLHNKDYVITYFMT